jgi:hypothetical protein
MLLSPRVSAVQTEERLLASARTRCCARDEDAALSRACSLNVPAKVRSLSEIIAEHPAAQNDPHDAEPRDPAQPARDERNDVDRRGATEPRE